jgi:hypothetical protein
MEESRKRKEQKRDGREWERMNRGEVKRKWCGDKG